MSLAIANILSEVIFDQFQNKREQLMKKRLRNYSDQLSFFFLGSEKFSAKRCYRL